MYNFVSLGGIFVILCVAYALSCNRRNMNWRLVAWGVGLQMLFALIIFRVPVGATILLKAGDLVTAMLAPAQKGAQFLFGPLASPDSMGFIIAFQVLPTIIFFSALVSILYYFGIMQIVIRGFARVFSRLMRISGAESLCAASNIFEAVINGANSGLRLIGGIIALLVAVLGLVGLIDLLLGAVGVRINNLCGISMDWSLTGLLSLIFYPFSLVAGVHPTDAAAVAHVIAQRTVETEFVAYMSLGRMLADGTIIHPRSAIIASYALCGFAHFASVGIFVGGVSALVPERIRDISRLGLRALVAATLACLMTACMAGAFLPDNPLLFSGQ